MDASLPLKSKRSSLLGCAVRGALTAFLLMLLLLAAAALFAYKSSDPTALVAPLGYAVAMLGAFFAGLLCARRRGRQGLLCGLLSGVLFLVPSAIGYLALMGEGESTKGQPFVFYLLLLTLSLLGGILGAVLQGGPRRVRKVKRR